MEENELAELIFSKLIVSPKKQKVLLSVICVYFISLRRILGINQ